MKAILFVIYLLVFIYYIILGGTDDYLVKETHFVNSELSQLKKSKTSLVNGHIPLSTIIEIEEKYKKSHNKEKEILGFQRDRVKFFSVLIVFVFIFLININTWNTFIYLSPFLYITGKLIYEMNVFYSEFIFPPMLAMLVAYLFKTKFKFWGDV